MEKSTILRKLFVAFNTLLLIGFAFICLYPVWYVVMASLSNSDALSAYRGFLWAPVKPSFDAYIAIAQNNRILQGYANTLFVVLVSLLFNISLTAIGAYFLSRKDLMLKKAVMIYIMITMYFSGGIIPLYLTVRNVGLYNSLWALVLPTAINTYNLILMRTAFEAVPNSLVEAALIDGAGHISIIFKVILPLTKATIAVMVLYYGVAHWNSWFNAMMYIQDKAKYPLQLILREILIQNDTSSMTQGASLSDTVSIAKTIKYAVIVVSTIPVMCVYPFLQKYFSQGVMVGAVKG